MVNLLKSFTRKFYIGNIHGIILLFLCIFFIYGIFVNSNNQNAYTLQHAGIEAIVERGTLYVDGSSTPQLKQVGDVFSSKGHLYAAKQPGQFFIGAIVYFFLQLVGITYKDNYLLASSLVTWLTSGLMTSLIVLMIFRLSFLFTVDRRFSVLISVFYGLGTIVFPYSGVAHHDIYATFLIFTSFYFLVLNHHVDSQKILYTVLAGVAGGLSLFVSILPLFILLAEILYLLSYRRWRSTGLFFLVCGLSVSPLLLYNYYAFGNPILQANIAGNFYDTYPVFSLENIVDKLRFYFYSPSTCIFVYSPAIIFSIPGILFLPRQYTREKIFLLLQFFFLSAYLVNMTTVGHCQYGPRYSLPALPFLCLGLCGYWKGSTSAFNSKLKQWYLYKIIAVCGFISIIICMVGALQGTMYCSLNIWAFKSHLGKIINGDFPEFPLFKVAFPLFWVTLFIGILKYRGIMRERLNTGFSRMRVRISNINYYQWLKNNAYMLLIIFLAIFLRVINLSWVPNGFYCDEASIGYNAYSILQTGKDEHGEILPLYFKAFGEYKNPVYIYTVIPFIKIFGLNEFAVRFTSAMFGVLTVYFTYLVAKQLFNKTVGLIAALLLTISPWHLQFSRIAFEAISLPCFFTISFYFLLKGLNKGRYLFYSAILFALTFYTYAPAKVFVPLFLAGFFALNFRGLLQFKREFVLSLLIGLLILAPLLILTFKGEGQSRFNIISIFTEHSLGMTRDGILNDKYWAPSFFKSLVNNKIFLISYSFIRNYLLHVSPDFLFFKGDLNSRHNIGAIGQLYRFECILLVIGLIFIFVKRRKEYLILAWWFFMFPVSSSLTYESIPHAVRTICGLPVFQIIAAVSIDSLYGYFKQIDKSRFQYREYITYVIISISIAFLVLVVFNIRYYFARYYKVYSSVFYGSFDYGMKEIIQSTENLRNIDFYSFSGMGNPYIFVLFYTGYNPAEWQNADRFDKYSFDGFSRSTNRKQALIVRAGNFPQYKTIQTIFFPDGRAGYEIKEVAERRVDVLDIADIRPEFIGGLRASYYNGKNFNNSVLSRTDKVINFDWGRGSPVNGVNGDNFSVRWEGLVKVDSSGEYKFYTVSDDGVRLIIDEHTIIDNWKPHRETEDSAAIYMDRGWHRITVEYNDIGFDAIIKLLWSTPSMNRTVVPSDHLSFYDK